MATFIRKISALKAGELTRTRLHFDDCLPPGADPLAPNLPLAFFRSFLARYLYSAKKQVTPGHGHDGIFIELQRGAPWR